MSKFVAYNGKTESSYFSYPPVCLKRKIIYEVIEENNLPNQKNLVLKGVTGQFCSDWFDEIPVKLGTCNTVPSTKMNFFYQPINTKRVVPTSPILSVEHIYHSTYMVFTADAVYIVKKEV